MLAKSHTDCWSGVYKHLAKSDAIGMLSEVQSLSTALSRMAGRNGNHSRTLANLTSLVAT